MKLFNVRINAKNVVIALISFDIRGQLLYAFSTAAIPSESGMLVSNELTSIVTKKLFGGIFLMLFILFIK